MTSGKRDTIPVDVDPPCEVVDYERGWDDCYKRAVSLIREHLPGHETIIEKLDLHGDVDKAYDVVKMKLVEAASWEAGRAAALEVLMNLRSKAVLRTTEWSILNNLVHLVGELQPR